MYLDQTKTAAGALFAREIVVNSTSWNRCMNNTTCKIIAIVAIVVASLLLLWVLSFIIRCACLGFACAEAICCCCSSSKKTTTYVERPLHYYNPNMYPSVQPMRQAEPSYQPVNNGYNGYNYGYKPQHF